LTIRRRERGQAFCLTLVENETGWKPVPRFQGVP